MSTVYHRSAAHPFSPGQHYAWAARIAARCSIATIPEWHALAPEREALRRWSYRLSQLLIPAIDLRADRGGVAAGHSRSGAYDCVLHRPAGAAEIDHADADAA